MPHNAITVTSVRDRAHQSTDSDDRLVAKHAHFDLRAVKECNRLRGHTFLDKIQMPDGFSWKLDFGSDLKLDMAKPKMLNDLRTPGSSR
jgi:hypothetical protein